jgi:hypothetical protein
MPKQTSDINRLRQNVQKAGIPTEIRVTAILEKYGWEVTNQLPYYDFEKHKTRTIDMYASKTFELPAGTQPDTLSASLIVECKSSQDKAWLFYQRPKETSVLAPLKYSLTQGFSDEFQAKLLLGGPTPETALFLNSHYFSPEFPDRAITHLVDSPDRSQTGDQIFTALNQVAKATNYLVQQRNRIRQLSEARICLYYPLVVFEGQMFEIRLKGDDPQIAPISYVQYDFTQSLVTDDVRTNASASARRYLIDITERSYLPTFLKVLKREEATWGTDLESVRKKMLKTGQRLIEKERRKS